MNCRGAQTLPLAYIIEIGACFTLGFFLFQGMFNASG